MTKKFFSIKKKRKKMAFRPTSKFSYIQNAQKWKWFTFTLVSLGGMFCPELNITRLIKVLLHNYEVWNKCNGIEHAIKRFKYLYECCLNYSCSKRIDPLADSWLKSDSDGMPVMVSCLKPYLRSTPQERMVCLILLNTFRETGFDPEFVKTDKITDPRMSQQYVLGKPGKYFSQAKKEKRNHDFHENLSLAWRELLEEEFPKAKLKQRLTFLKNRSDQIHVSTKNGPNGPSVACSSIDFLALKYEAGDDGKLLNSIKRMAILTRNKSLVRLLNSYEKDTELNEKIYPEIKKSGECSFITSKLAIKHGEVWCKERLFAIGDHLSQSSLKGMHDYMFNWLSEQPGDGSFCQDLVAEEVKFWTGNKEISGVYSADLSSATDHIPAKLLYEIVFAMFGEDIAQEWFLIMTGRTFSYTANNETINVKYSTGQPLGLLTSWAVMAIWHHLMFRLSFKIAKKEYLYYIDKIDKDLKPYQITKCWYQVLGDDSSNIYAEVSKIYNKIVVDFCDIGINQEKGFHPDNLVVRERISSIEDVGTVKSAEFAKRVFTEGIEVTTVPPSLMIEGLESPTIFCELMLNVQRRTDLDKQLCAQVGTSLLSLHKAKRAAFRQSTFPLWATLYANRRIPEKDVQNDAKGLNINLSVEESMIYSLSRPDLIKKTKLHLNGQIADALQTSFVDLVNNVNLIHEGSFKTCSKYQFSSHSGLVLWDIVHLQYIKALRQAEEGLITEAETRNNVSMSRVIKLASLRELLSRLSLIITTNDLITRKRRGATFIDRKVSKLISSLTKEAIKPLPFMTISASKSYFKDTDYIFNII